MGVTQEFEIFYYTTLGIFTVLSLIGNSITSLVFIRYVKFATSSNMYLMNLLLACWINFLSMIMQTFDSEIPHTLEKCTIREFLLICGNSSSLFAVFLVALDRLVAFQRPLAYKTTWRSRSRYVLAGNLAHVVLLGAVHVALVAKARNPCSTWPSISALIL